MNKTYLNYTQNWQNLLDTRNVLEISNHLNSGFSFHIDRKEYEKMKAKNPNYVHYYFGIEDGKFKILVIDDVSDKESAHDFVFEKELSNHIGELESREVLKCYQNLEVAPNANQDYLLPLVEALNRSFRWKMFSHNWLSIKYKGLRSNERIYFPMIANPFEDLVGIFEPEENGKTTKSDYAHHFFGLKRIKDREAKDENGLHYAVSKMSDYMIDIIVTNITDSDNTKEYFADRSCLCTDHKSYNKEKYSLLPDY
ncbi:hypothetical protein [Kordia sp.]|uniref:hypothetical protein n=1 Tax=Kordia sp. TaxID=1965332 RepID=UPI003D28C263